MYSIYLHVYKMGVYRKMDIMESITHLPSKLIYMRALLHDTYSVLPQGILFPRTDTNFQQNHA